MREAALQPGARWDDLIVLCAANSWSDVKLADRHMAERLTAHAPVLYVDPPISHLTRFNKPSIACSLDGPRLRMVAPRIARYTPVVAAEADAPRDDRAGDRDGTAPPAPRGAVRSAAA